MATVDLEAGICGFVARIEATSADGQLVNVKIESTCPNLTNGEFHDIDAYTEMFKTPHETEIYRRLAAQLPHTACALYSAVFKAVEVAAGLALPADVVMRITR